MPIEYCHRELWERIRAHRFDDPTARLTFTARLARENGWEIGHAIRVVDEYRRFVFLALTAGQAVTPSEDVDQVWHLHLAYTRDYWEIFCRDVLGAALHHGPTRGGRAEAHRYDTQYRQTLAAYETAFDAAPPADIWPAAERRFSVDLAWRRVNTARNWVIQKPVWLTRRPRRSASAMAALTTMPVIAAGIPNPLDLPGEPFLLLFALLAVGALTLSFVLRRSYLPEGDESLTARDVDPLELALLADDGRSRLTAVGLALLFAPGEQPPIEEEKKSTFSLTPSPPPEASRPLADLHARLAALAASTPLDAVRAMESAIGREFEKRLVDRGLLTGSWWDSSSPWMILTPVLATLGLGVVKIFVGISRDKPVGFLVLGCIVLATVSFFTAARKPRRTKQGDAILQEAQSRFRDSGGKAAWRERRETAALPLAVALLGPATLIGSDFSFANSALNTYRNLAQTGSSSDTGDGGGDGGGGGGCGGCGGCGGGGD
jgi:uncharacterized protein (TIGR04222 family)